MNFKRWMMIKEILISMCVATATLLLFLLLIGFITWDFNISKLFDFFNIRLAIVLFVAISFYYYINCFKNTETVY